MISLINCFSWYGISDVFPVILDEASVPATLSCAYDVSQQGQDFYTVSGAADKGNTSPDSPSQLSFLSFLEVPYSSKSQMCSVVNQKCSSLIDLRIGSSDNFPLCSIDVELSNGCLETAKIDEETDTNLMRSTGTLNEYTMGSDLEVITQNDGSNRQSFFTIKHGDNSANISDTQSEADQRRAAPSGFSSLDGTFCGGVLLGRGVFWNYGHTDMSNENLTTLFGHAETNSCLGLGMSTVEEICD
ncbi:hypothetical protein ACLOJK_013327 [Asimina triloba]